MIICKLGLSLGCTGLKEDNTCSIYRKEAVKRNVNKGSCIFRNMRAPKIGIYKPKGPNKRNPLKVSKKS